MGHNAVQQVMRTCDYTLAFREGWVSDTSNR